MARVLHLNHHLMYNISILAVSLNSSLTYLITTVMHDQKPQFKFYTNVYRCEVSYFLMVMHTYVRIENKSSFYSPSSLDAIGYEDYVLWKVYHLPKFGFPSTARPALNCKQSSHETKQKTQLVPKLHSQHLAKTERESIRILA